MSEPAIFALIRDGETRYFADRWASALLRREVLWGPEDFETWVTQFDELDEWDDCCDGGAVVDFDNKSILWCGDTTAYAVPRVRAVYHKLFTSAWPGYKAFIADNVRQLENRLGIELHDEEEPGEEDEKPWEDRAEAIEDVRLDDPDDDGEDEEDDLEEGGFLEPRAWVTVISEDGSPRHRQLEQLPQDLLKCKHGAIEAASKLPPGEIPAEATVSEGMWVNPKEKTAGVWGSAELLQTMKHLGGRWSGWKLQWSKRGYAAHCAACGEQGIPMSEEEALAKVLPLVLSTEQFNMGTLIGALGGGVKKTAVKATGCLLFVVCLPLVLFGFFSGNWTAVLSAIGGTLVVVVGLFKYVSYRVRKAVLANAPGGAGEEPSTLVAGPQEEDQRRDRIDQLLASAGLPALNRVEPLFPDATGIELLAT